MSIPIKPDDCAEKLSRMFDEQTEICRQIKALSEQQQKLVEERREDELLTLLSDKQRLLDRHEQLSTGCQPYREAWDGLREQAGASAHARVEASWEKLRSVLNDIVTLEDASRALLQEQKNRVSMDINKIQRGKIANKAYGGGSLPPPQARFSDKKG